MSKWTANTAAGVVIWHEGLWDAGPPAYRDDLEDLLNEGELGVVEPGPSFDPLEDPERALVAAIIVLDGEATFSDEAPIAEVVPPLPDDSVG